MKIESFQRTEAEATEVIASFAFNLFKLDPSKTEFVLKGTKGAVRIRVFDLPAHAPSSKVA